jgi:hypothetical protein
VEWLFLKGSIPASTQGHLEEATPLAASDGMYSLDFHSGGRTAAHLVS